MFSTLLKIPALFCQALCCLHCHRQVHRRRSRLPAAKPLGRGFSVWSVLKDMIGKDLTRITMPATINEPLTFLQRWGHRVCVPLGVTLGAGLGAQLWVRPWCTLGTQK